MQQQVIVRSSAPTAISLHSKQHDKRDAIEKMLAVLAEARQASISAETYEVYSSRLAAFPIEDIAPAVEKLMFQRREQGETALPDLPTLADEIKTVRNARLRAEREQRERDEAEAEERHRREHPEEYFSVAKMIDDFVRRKGIEIMPPEKPKQACCPHCSGVQLSAFTAADLRALADVVEKREALGTPQNRGAA